MSAVLSAIFNCFALNAAVLLACLPLITLPAALEAAVVVVDRWHEDGEDRVVREFVAVLRARAPLAATLAAGAPLLAAAVAAEEVRYFGHRGGAGASICLGLGVAGLLVSLASFGYALVLGARRADLAPSDLWYLSVLLTVRNLLSISPLLVGELVTAAWLLFRDPSLAVIGLPLALVGLIRVTAGRGIGRHGLADP